MAQTTETATRTEMSSGQKATALLVGAVLTIVGILGFMDVFVENNQLLGIFGINPLHNIVHLLSGALGLVAGYTAAGAYSDEYNKYLGLTYIALFALGIIAVLANIDAIVNLLNLDMADNFLHLALGLLLAGVGYGMGRRRHTSDAR